MKPDPTILAQMVQDNSRTAGVLAPLGRRNVADETQQRKDPVVALAGTVTSAPAIQETSKGQLVKLSFGIKTGYDQGDGLRFVDLAVWNGGLQHWVMANVYKGAKIAVEGFYSTREYNGKTYEQISVVQIGLVEYGTRSKRDEVVAPLVNPSAPAEAEW